MSAYRANSCRVAKLVGFIFTMSAVICADTLRTVTACASIMPSAHIQPVDPSLMGALNAAAIVPLMAMKLAFRWLAAFETARLIVDSSLIPTLSFHFPKIHGSACLTSSP
jgi:hypothetical protein